MITVDFQFIFNQNPELAAQIQDAIRNRVANDPRINHGINANVQIEYRGENSAMGLNMPMIIDIESDKRILEIAYEEIGNRVQN